MFKSSQIGRQLGLSLALAAGVGMALTVAACAAQPSPSPEQKRAAAAPRTTSARAASQPAASMPVASQSQVARPAAVHKDALGRFGVEFRQVLTKVDLRAPQRQQIEGLLARVADKVAPLRRMGAHLVRRVAAALRHQRLAGEELLKLADGLRRYLVERLPELHAVLDELHGILTRDQRRQLVAAVQERWHRRGARRHHRMAEFLGLSTGQVEQIRSTVMGGLGLTLAALHARKDRRRERHARMAAAFVRDDFNAASLKIGRRLRQWNRGRIAKILDIAEIAAGVLSADQRDALAGHLERKATKLANFR